MNLDQRMGNFFSWASRTSQLMVHIINKFYNDPTKLEPGSYLGIFWGAPKSLKMVTADGGLLLGRKVKTNIDSIFISRDVTLPTKVRLVKAMVFPVVMYGCESRTVKKAEPIELMLLTVVLEKTFESPMDCKEIQSVHSKGDQSWVFIARNDAKAETPILWPPDAKS